MPAFKVFLLRDTKGLSTLVWHTADGRRMVRRDIDMKRLQACLNEVRAMGGAL